MSVTTRVNSDRLRTWASEQLGLSADATAGEARAALFKRLDRADFSIPESSIKAAALLDPSTSLFPDLSQQVEQEIKASQLREGQIAVDEFASRFWETELQTRRTRWHILRVQFSALNQLAERLQQLEPGLDLNINLLTRAFDIEHRSILNMVKTLQETIIEWFPLAPSIRASRRRTWLNGTRIDGQWANAAKYLIEHHPIIAALDQAFLAFLVNRKQMTQFHASGSAHDATDNVSGAERSSGDSNNVGAWTATVFIILFVLGLVRTCAEQFARTRSHSSTRYPIGNSDNSNPSNMKDTRKAEREALLRTKTIPKIPSRIGVDFQNDRDELPSSSRPSEGVPKS